MLVLSRKLNQEILIGDNIKITVLKVKGNTIRLGIEAPREIHVVRGEIPRKCDVVPQEAPKEIEADFTVVFTNTDDSAAKVDVIPFENSKDSSQKKMTGNKPFSNSGSQPFKTAEQEASSIKFRDRLPKALHHNRLKEIVNQLTSK